MVKGKQQHLQRQLDLWKKRDYVTLMDEGRCLQKLFRTNDKHGKLQGQQDLAREFGLCMASDRVHQALRLLEEKQSAGLGSGLLHLDEVITLSDGTTASVEDLLK